MTTTTHQTPNVINQLEKKTTQELSYMKTEYPFLQDSQARQEIYKHKWIESEKAGREIGFATAAHDWISRHGEAWLEYQRKKLIEMN